MIKEKYLQKTILEIHRIYSLHALIITIDVRLYYNNMPIILKLNNSKQLMHMC